MANLKGGTTIGGYLALHSGNGILLNNGNFTMSGNIYRSSHSSGYLIGSYNNVGANGGNTNPIYTIGSSYMPSDTAFNNMYGIGYSTESIWGSGKSTGWGLYVIEAGGVKATISSSGIWSSGSITATGGITSTGGGITSASNVVAVASSAANSGFVLNTYVTNGRSCLVSIGVGAAFYGLAYYQGTSGRDGVDSMDFCFNTNTSATSAMSVKTNGDVRIKGVVSSGSITVTGSLSTSTSISVGTTLTTTSNITCNGAITAVGNITAGLSDSRLKSNLGNIESPLDKIKKLNGFYYKHNELASSFGYETNNIYLGLYAQEVQELFPDLVTIAPFDRKSGTDEIISKTGENYLTLDYSKLVPLLIEAIKEQQKQIEKLKEI